MAGGEAHAAETPSMQVRRCDRPVGSVRASVKEGLQGVSRVRCFGSLQ